MPKFLLLSCLLVGFVCQAAKASAIHSSDVSCGPDSLKTESINGFAAQQLYNSLKEKYPDAWRTCGPFAIDVITVGTTSCIYDGYGLQLEDQYQCTAWLDTTGQGCTSGNYTCPFTHARN